MSLLNELESLRIPFADIKEATKNFTTVIGKGGYGLVYRGELLLSGKLNTVAIKRLDNTVSGQGFKEFLTEIYMLTRYKHPNLIPLIGFCDQDNEKILIYEHAERGSLDKYLSAAEKRSKLTWGQRINICVNTARGVNYLHNGVATNERVIHRDIKSANVLLDRNWKAMISDLGLSKLGRANEKDTFLITNASGTHGYCDPVYISSGILTKESDVYSFGVVMFEILCGRLCFLNVHNEHRFLPPLAQRYCKIGKIDEIIDPALKNQIDSDSLIKFSKIASQCLHNNRKRRPSMRTVVKKLEELEKALEFQQRQDTDQLLGKTQTVMGGAVPTGGEPPNRAKQFKRSLDDMQNNFISTMVKTTKRVHDIHISDSMQRESLFEADKVEPDQPKSEHLFNWEIAKFTDNGGLVDVEGVEKLIQVMKLESCKENVHIARRVMLADVISVTGNKNCLIQFVESRGVHVLDEWLQEVNTGKIGDGTSIKWSNNSIEEFLFALLHALDVLPVNLHALQMSNVGKNVNHLRSHQNSDIQKKSRSLVDKWKMMVLELKYKRKLQCRII
uniref:probable receptor-like protein kinase At5g59700 n=1 Tax=Erigeron canadensis TaxID=72917 RepID=UPI001CB94A5B|nr:probable receptor-like protein kinase At5g59700 [Erigeron canadensis]